MSLEVRPETEQLIRRAESNGVSVDDLLLRTFAPGQPEDPRQRVQALLRKWQVEDVPRGVPTQDPNHAAETPALFARWREEDAAMTDEEREAEDRLWAELEPILLAGRHGHVTPPTGTTETTR